MTVSHGADTLAAGNTEPEGNEMTMTDETQAAEVVEPEPAAAPLPAESESVDAKVEAAMVAWRASGEIEPEHVSTLPEISRWQQMESMAKTLARSSLMPKHIREARDPEADCMVTLMTANDLGISATLAFQKIAVIDGKPAQQAELMRILAFRDGHKVWVTVERDGAGRPIAATCHVIRKDDPESAYEATYTLHDAVTAGLCSIDPDTGNPKARSSGGKRLPWEAFTEDMLVARASSRGLRRACPDSLGGVSYTPEELGQIENLAGDERIDAPQAVLDTLIARVDKMNPDVKATVAAKWKAARIGTLKPAKDLPLLSTDQIAVALKLLDDAEFETPEDAVVIVEHHAFEGPEGSVECVTCSNPPDHELHQVEQTAGPEESGHSDESPDTARGSDVPVHTSDQGPGATTAPGAAVDHHHGDGRPVETTADPTADEPVAASEPVPGPVAPPELPAGRETGTQPVSRAAVRLPDLGRKKAQRVVEIEVTIEGQPAKLYQVGYQLVSLPLAAKVIEPGTHVEFVAQGVTLLGVSKGDYVAGQEPF